MQNCTKCREDKPSTSFQLNQLWCKSCKNKNYLANKTKYSSEAKARYAINSEKVKARVMLRYKEKRDEVLIQAAEYYQNLPAKMKLKIAKNSADRDRKFPHLMIARTALRRARLAKATPNWLTRDEIKEIQDLYLKARDLTLSTGIPYHVDHIYPIRGKLVCGLHVFNNLRVITGAENVRKSNKIIEVSI